jgi:hypothetical protein
MLVVCSWFKGYFSWVNNAPCEHCGSGSTSNAGAARPNAEESLMQAGVVELYKCNECGKTTRFPRYNHPGKLMETRRGRCGEWANAFTLCCIAMGFEARHVVDWTDHVWTEVFSEDQQRWIHCDACENCWDSPLLYSEGWAKKLTYVVAFSKDETVDVTCRYTRQWDECKARRTLCPELWLAEMLASMRMAMLASLPTDRRRILEERASKEKEELAPRNYVKPADPPPAAAAAEPVLPGRTTGSLEWRAARGELGNGPQPAQSEAGAAASGGDRPEVAGLTKSSMSGGVHADTTAFDDAVQVAAHLEQGLRVRGVTVWAGEGDAALVHGIQLHYVRKDGAAQVLFDGETHCAPPQEGALGLPPARQVLLGDGERISKVGGRAGALIDRLEIGIESCDGEVCSQRVEAFGGAGGSPFSCPVPLGHELAGLAGGTGGHLHCLSIYTCPGSSEFSEKGWAKVEAQAGCRGNEADASGAGKHGCGSTIVAQSPVSAGASGKERVEEVGDRMSDAEEEKLQLQKLIRHFFFEIQKEAPGPGDANAAAAKAVERAKEWLAANGWKAPLPC